MRRLGFECSQYTNPADFIIKLLSMPEKTELQSKKLEQIIDWAEKWKQDGKEFLKEWNIQGRECFIANTPTEATTTASSFRDVSFHVSECNTN